MQARTVRSRVACLLACVGLLFASCVRLSSAQNPYLPRADLEAEPASHLVMSNAELIRRVGHEREDTIDGPQPSFVGAVYGVQASREDVFAFYGREAERLGWRRQSFSPLSSGEIGSRAWCKEQMDLRVTIYDPARYARVDIEGGERFQTVFDASIVATGPGPCPAPVRTLPPHT